MLTRRLLTSKEPVRVKKPRPRKVETDARKRATQPRAIATTEAILEATAHILIDRGYAKLTTNHVAVRAGVSIGSVYQYFPSKEALVAALVDRHLERMWAIVAGELARAVDEPFLEATRRIIGALIRVHMVNPPLHRAVLGQVPRLGRMDKIREIDRQFEALLATALEARARDIDVRDVRLSAFVLVQSVKAVTMSALLERPEFSGDDRLADELAHLFVRYVERRPGPGASRPT
jgi:AcrR family transcriptional regulator